MAAQTDLQELLRIFTSRKIPMMTAMKNVQALQKQDLKTIDQIAQADFKLIETALDKETKLARFIQAACRAHGKKGTKRILAEDPNAGSSSAKKTKLDIHKHDLDYSSMSPDALETSLTLPLLEDEEAIKDTKIMTNRAPLVLAFAVELLRFTMPEQPPSSRLSLGQALVSANSKSKAISLGIEKSKSGSETLVSERQPKTRIMGREIPVLKRGGYAWSDGSEETQTSSHAGSVTSKGSPGRASTWTSSQKVVSKESVFIGHAAPLNSMKARANLISDLVSQKPELNTASHNAWAARTKYNTSPLVQEASSDDGESGCGLFMLQIMREADISNKVVVLTRWYGGVMLGPDRWRIMRNCVNEALSSQSRVVSLSGEPLWGLDMEDNKVAITTLGMSIHRPEAARNYLLRAFGSAQTLPAQGKKTAVALDEEKQVNLGKLMGALRLLFRSWASELKKEELDSRAWSWYVAVRPDVDHGPGGWGAKGELELGKILDLRRK